MKSRMGPPHTEYTENDIFEMPVESGVRRFPEFYAGWLKGVYRQPSRKIVLTGHQFSILMGLAELGVKLGSRPIPPPPPRLSVKRSGEDNDSE